MAAALASMVCQLTLGKEKYADVQDEIAALLREAEAHRQRFQQLMADDIAAYEQLSACFKMPRETEEQREERAAAVQKSLIQAALVPLEMTERALEVAKICERVAVIGNVNVLSDIAAAAMFAASAGTGAAWIWANHFLDQRGVKPITKREGALTRRAGHRTEDFTDIDNSIYRLSGLWITIEESFSARRKSGKKRVYHHKGRVLMVVETWSQNTLSIEGEEPPVQLNNQFKLKVGDRHMTIVVRAAP